MANLTVSLEEVRKQPANFLYIFTNFKVNGKAFLSYIDAKHRAIIQKKRDNQVKLLTLSAQSYSGNKDAMPYGAEWMEYYNAVGIGFKEIYGISPEKALVKLAKGETVAGKNWSQGMYGVQGIGKTNTFYGTNITVDPKTGHIFKDGTDITELRDTVSATVGKKVIDFEFFATDGDATYMSEYNTTYKKYYAKSYSNANGTFSADSGETQSKMDAATIWENIQLGSWDFLEWIKKLLEMLGLDKLFGNETETETINANNTLPNQRTDGYVQDDPSPDITTAAGITLAAVAAGTLLMGGIKRKKRK